MSGRWLQWSGAVRSHLDLNPVVVKELRQAVRSWFVTGVLLLFLAVLLLSMFGILAARSTNYTPDQGVGLDVFVVLVSILTAASLIFIPLYTGARLALERQEVNLDLLYITTLSPGRIIRGKLFCGIYLVLLFFSACLPFLVLSNMLRGVDLPAISLVLFLVFVVVCGAVQIAIFLACLPVSMPFKCVLGIASTGGLVSLTVGLSAMAQQVARYFILPPVEFWYYGTPFYLLAFGWFYVCSVALISPKSMNRAMPLRIYLTSVWLVCGAMAVYATVKYTQLEPMIAWLVGSLILIISALIVVVGNSDQLSVRVRRQIPGPLWKRIPALFFFNGAAQGLAWTLAITVLTGLSGWGVWMANEAWSLSTPAGSSYRRSVSSEFFQVMGVWCCYAYAYVLTGLFVQRSFFPRHNPAVASVLAFVIPAAWAILPNFALFLLDRLTWNVMETRQLGNVFNVMLTRDADTRVAHLWFSASWTLLALAVNVPWFVRQVKEFRPWAKSLKEVPS